jgi:hypothetical protein
MRTCILTTLALCLSGCPYSFEDNTNWLVIEAWISTDIQAAQSDRYPLRVEILQPNPEDPDEPIWIGQGMLCEPQDEPVSVTLTLGPSFDCWVPDALNIRIVQAVIDTQECGNDVEVYGWYDLDPAQEILWIAPDEPSCDGANGLNQYKVQVGF